MGHLVFYFNGPVCLVRAESNRVLLGFWRGQRLRHIEPLLKPGGKYEMATVELNQTSIIKPKIVASLVAEAVSLNASLGDPTELSSVGARARPNNAARRGR